MRNLFQVWALLSFGKVCRLALALFLAHLTACTNSQSPASGQGSPTAQESLTQGQTIAAQNPAATLSTSAIEARIRETFLVKIGEHCDVNLKKDSVRGSADLAYEATIYCGEHPPYRDGRYVQISIEDFFSLIDLIQSDAKELQARQDATADNQQLVSAFEKMFASGNGKELIKTKIGYRNDIQARKAMLAMLNMTITRHPYTNKKAAYDSVEWIDGASRDVSLAAAIAQICVIQSDDPTWNGEQVWLTKSDQYTPSHLVARKAAKLVFASVGADSTFTPPGQGSDWSMTTPDDFLSSFFWYDAGSRFCPDKNGPIELDKMINAIKSGEFARQWAALPTLSGLSHISLNGAYATSWAPEPGQVLSGTWINVQTISPPVGDRHYGVALTLRIPHKMPSRALEFTAETAKITFDAAVDGMKIRDELTREIRATGSTRREFNGWTAVSFASISKEARYFYADEFVNDVNVARKAFANKDEWLDAFVNYDTKKGASDQEFYNCRRTNVLPEIIFDASRRFGRFACEGGKPVWYMNE